jgi:hypothetical protein
MSTFSVTSKSLTLTESMTPIPGRVAGGRRVSALCHGAAWAVAMAARSTLSGAPLLLSYRKFGRE